MTETRTPLTPSLADELAPQLRGNLIRRGDSAYDEARKVYNAMIDRRPGAIARCADVADVIAAVNFARENNLLLAIRGGGHNGAGLGVCDDGLVIDLSGMRGIRVDPQTRTARVDGGCTWGDVDHATHAFGLATPSGIISTTGVGGLTLGGGIGNLTRLCGLTVDNLLEADVVTASGELMTASPDTHDDLYWALRGGGGNFGVVTSFRFNLHPVHTITGGPTFWHLDRAKEVMQWYREFIVEAPEELNGWFAFLTVPPVPPFPEELHLKKMCGVLWCYAGHPADAEAVFKPVRDLNPDLYGIQAMPLPGLQSAFDGLYPRGHQWYWKADFFRELSDDVIDRHIEFAHRLPTPQSTMHLYPINGAAHRKGRHETAWSYREANWGQVIVGVDPDPAKKDVLVEWAREYWEATHPYSSGGAYVNMMMDEGDERVKASYRDNYDRLAIIKAKFDPDNLFRVNQNITPANRHAGESERLQPQMSPSENA